MRWKTIHARPAGCQLGAVCHLSSPDLFRAPSSSRSWPPSSSCLGPAEPHATHPVHGPTHPAAIPEPRTPSTRPAAIQPGAFPSFFPEKNPKPYCVGKTIRAEPTMYKTVPTIPMTIIIATTVLRDIQRIIRMTEQLIIIMKQVWSFQE